MNKPKGSVRGKRTLQRLVGEPLPDTLGKRYAVEDWKTDREPSGIIVAIAGKDLMMSRDDVARLLNDKDVTIDILRRRCEKLDFEKANGKVEQAGVQEREENHG